MTVKHGGFDPKEFEANCEIQEMFVNGQLPDISLFDVEFYFKTISGEIIPASQQQFFLYKGKWRNTNPDSEFGRVTFEEGEIRPTAFYSHDYYVK